MSGPALPASGFDPTAVINAGEQRLADYLAMPTHQLLDHMGVQVPSSALAAPAIPEAAHHDGAMHAMDPMQMISPVAHALSMLGSGGFPGMNPTNMLGGISNAFGGTSGPLQQALGAAQQGWQGATSTAAATKTGTALANGAEVATQASGLQSSLAAAAANVAQARTQLIEIIDEYMATLAASLPGLPFTLPTIVAAATKAITHTTEVMTETQSSLGAQAAAVSAAGAPVNVTTPPQLGTSMGGLGSMLGLGSSGAGMNPMGGLGSMLGLGSSGSGMNPMSAMSMMSPLMYGAMAGISPAMSAASAAGHGGNPAPTDPTAGTLAGANAEDPKAAAAAAAALKPGSGAGGGGGATAPSAASLPRFTAPTTPAQIPETTTLTAPTRPSMAGIPVSGGGMMGAPLAGAGASSAAAGGAHTAASFLHTSDQGGKVVGNRITVAPPVLGEVDPYDIPDIELRI